MRPTRLELEGFISFRERTEIDFSSLDLFGITGPTGAGKTALIDSIIFALYGKTPRLGEKVTQELISQGAPQLRVLLEFLCGDIEYRVLRIVKRKGPGRTQIERRREDGEWEPVAGSTRELRDRVEEIVGLDFDGFTRTVVLPQGQFDRFLRGDGAARRKILSDLLGLETYEMMMRRANEIARDANRQSTLLAEVAGQQFGAATPERIAGLEAEIAQAATAREGAAGTVAQLEKILPLVVELRQAEAEFARYQTERDRVRKSLETAAAQVAGVRQRIAQTRRELESTGYNAARHLEVAAILPVARRQAELARAIEALNARTQREAAEEARLAIQAEADRAAHQESFERLGQAAKNAQRAAEQWQDFRLKHGSVDLLVSTAREAAGYSKLEMAIASLQRQLESDRTAAADASRAHEAAVESEQRTGQSAAGARQALDKLRIEHAAAGVRQLLELGEPCPVCQHPVEQIPESGHGHASLAAAQQELQNREAEHEQARRKTAAERQAIEAIAKRREVNSQKLEHAQQSLAALALAIERITTQPLTADPLAAVTQLAAQARAIEAAAAREERALRDATASESGLRHAMSETEARLALARQASAATTREAAEKHRELQAAARQFDVEALAAEAAALEEARDRHERLAATLLEAERAASKAEVDERTFSERFSLAEANLKTLSERIGSLHGQLEGVADSAHLEQRLAESRAALQTFDRQLQAATIARQTLADQAREAEELARRVATFEKEGAVYAKLGTMLRTDQFVAWILKDAFARLAYEGSRQLELLSNGRYTFAAGGDDFAVCDRWNAGERRSVHTLSGGESFLASLSLALALSRGLPEFAANRDRFHLDSLFLDEGFSTLDAETLDTVLGAVEMLQADCRLIGVISHATELADRLPGRIEVVKGANGSRVLVR